MLDNQTTMSTPDGNGQTQQATPNINPPQENQGEGKNQQDIDLSEKLAQIAKRSRFLEGREKGLSAKEKEILAKEEELSKKYSRYQGLDDVKNPVQVLEKLGYSLDDIIEASLSGELPDGESKSKPDPKISTLEQELKELKEQIVKQKEESTKKEEERTVAYQKQILQNLIGENAEKYPFANKLGKEAVDQAWTTIYDHLQETGELLDYDKVIEEIENNAVGYLKGFTDIPNFHEKIGLAEKLAAAQKEREANQPRLPQEEERKVFENDPWSQPSRPIERDFNQGEKFDEMIDSLSDDELERKAAQLIRWDRQN